MLEILRYVLRIAMEIHCHSHNEPASTYSILVVNAYFHNTKSVYKMWGKGVRKKDSISWPSLIPSPHLAPILLPV